jgi:ubiquinone/menaquinone biosynthesis C-methylase UbiE
MEHALAVDFIRDGVDRSLERWADLGAGSGTFTLALADVLGVRHSIVAFDSDPRAMQSIPTEFNGVKIRKIIADFGSYNLGRSEFDGLIIANALHFIADTAVLLKSLKDTLSPNGRIIVVEYDTTISSRWIPYPLDFELLRSLTSATGFEICRKIKEVKSAYGEWNIYSALIHSVK